MDRVLLYIAKITTYIHLLKNHDKHDNITARYYIWALNTSIGIIAISGFPISLDRSSSCTCLGSAFFSTGGTIMRNDIMMSVADDAQGRRFMAS